MDAPVILPTVADVDEAARRLAGVALHTPLLSSAALDDMTGGRVFLKAETLQRTGSFKFRGAYNKLAALPPEQRAGGVVAFSSGNHAQGVAAAARMLGMRCVIVMPSTSIGQMKAVIPPLLPSRLGTTAMTTTTSAMTPLVAHNLVPLIT